jgi:hypothetical protein
MTEDSKPVEGAKVEDVNVENPHSIAERETEAVTPAAAEDGVLYCHFIPKKEFVEKGTPWIIHTATECHVCATVTFESMAMMRTAGPGGEAPDPVVCHCGVSRHHLRLEGYVSMSKQNTAHPVATIRSHRQATLANVPLMEQQVQTLEKGMADLKKKNTALAKKLSAEHEAQTKLRTQNQEWKRQAAEHESKLDSERREAASARGDVKKKELLVQQFTQQLVALRESNGGGKANQAKAEKLATAKKAAKKQETDSLKAEIRRYQADVATLRKATNESDAVAERQANELARLRAELERELERSRLYPAAPVAAETESSAGNGSERSAGQSDESLHVESAPAAVAPVTVASMTADDLALSKVNAHKPEASPEALPPTQTPQLPQPQEPPQPQPQLQQARSHDAYMHQPQVNTGGNRVPLPAGSGAMTVALLRRQQAAEQQQETSSSMMVLRRQQAQQLVASQQQGPTAAQILQERRSREVRAGAAAATAAGPSGRPRSGAAKRQVVPWNTSPANPFGSAAGAPMTVAVRGGGEKANIITIRGRPGPALQGGANGPGLLALTGRGYGLARPMVG